EADHDVLQLAHVAGEPIGDPTREARAIELERPATGLARVERSVVVEETHLVVAQVAQRRNDQRENREAMVEVGAEASEADLLAQVAIGRGDDARAARACRGLANALVLAILEHAQQLRLQLERELADLVEEKRALARVLEI